MSFPDMSREHGDWARTAKFTLVDKTTEDHEVNEDLTNVATLQGIFYQHKPQEIAWKPEGQRRWRWWHLISTGNVPLDSLIEKDGVKYRVWEKTDWSLAGYYEYEVAESFQEV